ncbi:hypothetical protein ABAC402_02795 [Asticcacaulis sp. AC402]|nr:hypothetical protein ABAC402_02795 [Asticcacaulis sp. AC402]
MQRGNRREAIFFEAGDQEIYLDLLAEQLRRCGVACWTYCLMKDHVHLILTPSDETGLSRALGEAHRRYTSFIGSRNRWTGHLFQGRFSSVAMDEDHLLAALRSVALKPVMAQLVGSAEDWLWSSVRAHLAGKSTKYVDVEPALDRVGAFADFLGAADETDDLWNAVLKSEVTGRPVGSPTWLRALEDRLGYTVTPQKRGPKPKVKTSDGARGSPPVPRPKRTNSKPHKK